MSLLFLDSTACYTHSAGGQTSPVIVFLCSRVGSANFDQGLTEYVESGEISFGADRRLSQKPAAPRNVPLARLTSI